MKKLFALLFVCAGLTAMAVTPRVDTNVKVASNKTSMVLKSSTLTNQLASPVMKISEKTMTPQKLFAEKGITPAQNKLMKKAPRRVGVDDVTATKIGFMLAYGLDENETSTVIANDYLYGGWEVDMEPVGDNQFNSYLFFTQIPFTINVNYDAVGEEGSAEMVMETLAGWHWIDTVRQGGTTYYYDTTEYVALWDEAFMLNNDPNAEPANLQGTLYEDGTIYFPEGWTLYDVMYVKTTSIRGGQTNTSYDTVAGLLCDFMHSTYLITANANHKYTSESTGNTSNVPAYMFQYDDTTAIAWNVWGMGNRGIEFYLRDNGVMEFPSYQAVYTEDIADYAAQYTQYDWSYAYEFYNFAIEMKEDGTGTDEDSLSEDSKMGTFDSKGLYWDASVIYDLIAQNNSFYFGLGFYPFINNELTFTGDDQFLVGTTETPIINAELTDDSVIVTAVPANDLPTDVALGIVYDVETGEVTFVDNPYTVERTDVDQTIIFVALAQAEGMLVSDWAVLQVVVPAKEDNFLRGDVDMDGAVSIADVTALIDYILSHDEEGIDLRAADCDEDEAVSIADVTALIDYILSHEW